MAVQSVNTGDSLEEGRVKWNANDSSLDSRLTTAEHISPTFTASFSGPKTPTTGGWIFDCNPIINPDAPGFEIAPGSVRLSVNGIVYTSNNSQTSSTNADYYIHSGLKKVVFKNTATGGSLDLIDDDVIDINFRRRNETEQNQPG